MILSPQSERESSHFAFDANSFAKWRAAVATGDRGLPLIWAEVHFSTSGCVTFCRRYGLVKCGFAAFTAALEKAIVVRVGT